MAAGDRNAGPGADRLAAVEDAADGVDRQLVDRHADQRQREQRRAAHRIDVGDRVGRGDGAEVERVVDDRHEEVGRRDDRLVLVDPVDGGVVGGLDADQQLRRHQRRSRPVRGSRCSTPGAILQPQPPPWLNEVRRRGGFRVRSSGSRACAGQRSAAASSVDCSGVRGRCRRPPSRRRGRARQPFAPVQAFPQPVQGLAARIRDARSAPVHQAPLPRSRTCVTMTTVKESPGFNFPGVRRWRSIPAAYRGRVRAGRQGADRQLKPTAAAHHQENAA